MSKPPIFSAPPYSATVTVLQTSHTRKDANDRGYYDIVTHMEQTTLLDITLTADSLEGLQEKIGGHISLVE